MECAYHPSSLPLSPPRGVSAAARCMAGGFELRHERELRCPPIVDAFIAQFGHRGEQEELGDDRTSDRAVASN
jgi:hypothetical protein